MSSTDFYSLKIMVKSIVCEDSNISGDVTISPGCVIHPSANIIAEAGPIILGENCIVEEYATIAYRSSPTRENQESELSALSIGANNVFEVGCTVESRQIGDKNVFECKSYVGPDVKISRGCVIGAGVRLQLAQQLPENTVIYGRNFSQRDVIDKYTLQMDFLRKVLPNYHHLHKPNHDPKKGRIHM